MWKAVVVLRNKRKFIQLYKSAFGALFLLYRTLLLLLKLEIQEPNQQSYFLYKSQNKKQFIVFRKYIFHKAIFCFSCLLQRHKTSKSRMLWLHRPIYFLRNNPYQFKCRSLSSMIKAIIKQTARLPRTVPPTPIVFNLFKDINF